MLIFSCVGLQIRRNGLTTVNGQCEYLYLHNSYMSKCLNVKMSKKSTGLRRYCCSLHCSHGLLGRPPARPAWQWSGLLTFLSCSLFSWEELLEGEAQPQVAVAVRRRVEEPDIFRISAGYFLSVYIKNRLISWRNLIKKSRLRQFIELLFGAIACFL